MKSPLPIEATMDGLRPGWRTRRGKRKSPWNLVCLALGWGAAAAYMNFFCEAALWLNVRIHPAHSDLSGHNFAFLEKASSPAALLMGLPLFMPGMICGFLTGNWICWLIPPSRRAMEKEAAGDREMSFAGSNAGLLKFGGIASGVCIILSLIGVFTF
jgi:hypothetical protein